MGVGEELSFPDEAQRHVERRHFVTSVGIAPDILAALTPYDMSCLLMYSSTLDDIGRWIMADLLALGEAQVAQRLRTNKGREFWDARDQLWNDMLRNCKSDIAKHTAYNMAACARAWPHQRRRHTRFVSFEHHRLLINQPPAAQDDWLDLVEAGEWSVSRLRRELYSGQAPVPLPPMEIVYPTPLWTPERVEQVVRNLPRLDHTTVTQLINTILKEIYTHEQADSYRQHLRR